MYHINYNSWNTYILSSKKKGSNIFYQNILVIQCLPVFQWTFSRKRLFSMFLIGHGAFSGLIFCSKWSKYFNYDSNNLTIGLKKNRSICQYNDLFRNWWLHNTVFLCTIYKLVVLHNSFLCLIRSKTWYAIPWNGILFPKLFWPSVRKNHSSD